MEFLKNNPKWIRQAAQVQISEDKVAYSYRKGYRLMNALIMVFKMMSPVFPLKQRTNYFSFIVKTEFEYLSFDQCGVAMYLNSDNWFKASVQNMRIKKYELGSVVTNHMDILTGQQQTYPLILIVCGIVFHEDSNYCIECDEGWHFQRQMRIFHMCEGAEKSTYGIYACSPTEGSYKATFQICRLRNVNGNQMQTGVIDDMISKDKSHMRIIIS